MCRPRRDRLLPHRIASERDLSRCYSGIGYPSNSLRAGLQLAMTGAEGPGHELQRFLIVSRDHCARMSVSKTDNIAVVPRLLTRHQAAAYCGVSVPTFVSVCPI